MPEPVKTTFDAIAEQAQKIGYGEWNVRMIIYDGRVTGFDQLEAPVIKFRERGCGKEKRE